MWQQFNEVFVGLEQRTFCESKALVKRLVGAKVAGEESEGVSAAAQELSDGRFRFGARETQGSACTL